MEDPDQVKRKDYQTVLLTGLDSSWFQDREATKRDVLSVGVAVLEEPCSDKDTGRALLKTATALGSGQDIKSESGRVQATVIYKETSALSIDLRDPSYIPLLVKTAKCYGITPSQKSNTNFVISGNLDTLVDFRRAFDEAIVSRGARESKTDPPLADLEASSAEHQDEPGHGKGSSLYPPSLYNSHPGHMPECLAIMNKVPQSKIPGVHYVPEEGIVFIDKSGDTNDAIARFSKEYQEVVKKMKMDRIDVPSRLSDAALKSLMEELDKKYSHIVFSVTSNPSSRTRQVKLVSISSRQFEPAKKLLSDRLNMLDEYVIPLGGPLHLTLKKDNIVTEDVDVIVNAANGRLKHGGGVALAINKASGGAVQQHSDDIMRRKKHHGEFKVGEAVTTCAGGTLKCKHVIHAVGPTSSHRDSEGALKMVIRNILKEAARLEVRSVAIPAISSGLFSVDKDLVARCILDTLFSYNYPKDAPVLSDIRVVIIDSPTYQCFASYLIQTKKIPSVKKVCSTDKAEARPDGKLEKLTLEEAGSRVDAADDKMEIAKEEGVDECAKITTLLLPIASRWYELRGLLNKTGVSITGATSGDNHMKLQHVIQKWWEISRKDVCQKLEDLIKVLGEMKQQDLAMEVWKAFRLCPEILGGTGEGSRDRVIAGTEEKPLTPYSTPTSEMPPGGFPAADNSATSAITTTTTADSLVSTGSSTVPQHIGSGSVQAGSHLEDHVTLGGGHMTTSGNHMTPGMNYAEGHMGASRAPGRGHDGDDTTPGGDPVTHIDHVTGTVSPPPGLTAGTGNLQWVKPQEGTRSHTPTSSSSYASVTTSSAAGSAQVLFGEGGAQTTTVSSSGVSRMFSNAPTLTSAYAEYPALTQHGRLLVGSPSAESSATTQPAAQKSHGECPICLHSFTDPVVVPCGHKLCNGCIQHLQGFSCCPICKKAWQPVQALVKEYPPPDAAMKKSPEDKDECPVCLHNITDPLVTTCGHKFCKKCLEQWLKNSSYCPTCKSVLQPLKGNQPPGGDMNIERANFSLPGYQGTQTLVITYYIPDGKQGPNHPKPGRRYTGTTRKAYLPYIAEGIEVAELLKTAFKAGLTFTVGTSHTTGQSNVVVWNDIHHKTSPSHGQYGYPDHTYLSRVKQDLAAKGIVSQHLDTRI